MAAPTFDETKPTFGGNPVDGELDQLRDNLIFLQSQIGATKFYMMGWSSVVAGSNPAEIDSVTLTKNGSSIKLKGTFTWSSGNLATEQWQYDKGLGAGFETFVNGTITHTYDGSENWTGATSA